MINIVENEIRETRDTLDHHKPQSTDAHTRQFAANLEGFTSSCWRVQRLLKL